MDGHTVLFVAPTGYQRLMGIIMGLVLMYIAVTLVRKFRLKEEHGLPWFLGSLVVIVFCVFSPLLKLATLALGVGNPSAVLFVGSFFFLAVHGLSLSCVVSQQKRQIETLARELTFVQAANQGLSARKATTKTESSEGDNANTKSS